MKLGLAVEYAGKGVDVPIDLIKRCEAMGYDSVWTAEAYGSDAITPLAFIAAHTKKIRLGTGVIQLSARTPAMTAMQLGTVDALAGGGRVIGGLGVSGPQIVEGWYGMPWGNPKENGKEIQLPYKGPGSTGMGKPLKSILHYEQAPKIWLGTGARATVELTAEVADGWLAFGMRPGNVDTFKSWFEAGFARAGGGKSYKDFEIQGGTSVTITDDVKTALQAGKPFVALYVGGMGHPKLNFHNKRMHREGYGDAADRILELFQAGKRDEAVAAVPDEYMDEGGLFGPVERIRERWRGQWEKMPYTGITVRTEQEEAYELMANLAGTRDQ
jgi:alkanesulfonate monooxygenase SsuD/methylene tetrahydromethanopterin reductase-like flavin-dependent oxidoreductase (luciferase family)